MFFVHCVFCIFFAPLRLHYYFNGFAIVHGTIACWNFVETNNPVEDAARLNVAFEDVRKEMSPLHEVEARAVFTGRQ
jgi:hypothetical protein